MQLIEFNSISCITHHWQHNMQKWAELSSYWQSKRC